MLGVKAAIETVLEHVAPTGCESVPLGEASGRVLGEDIFAGADVPAFANSQMDGVAVRAADLANASEQEPVFLALGETRGAGYEGDAPLAPGEACRIMTGAPVPAGADAVVPVEDLLDTGVANQAGFRAGVPKGQFIRPAGEDLAAGTLALPRGRWLRPADIGLMASLGLEKISCGRRPRVAILGTGSELVPLGQPLAHGKIHDSNAWALAASVREAGALALPSGIVADDRNSLRTAFEQALSCDVVISTGGVSVGDFDYVKDVMAEIGLTRHFWRVAQKPGKPITFSTGAEGQLFFGLPGNPVSAMVCFELYVAPALRAAAGRSNVHLPWGEVEVRSEIATAERFHEMVRCKFVRPGTKPEVEPTGTQSSGALRSLSLADCLLISPPGTAVLRSGGAARAIFLRAGNHCMRQHAFD